MRANACVWWALCGCISCRLVPWCLWNDSDKTLFMCRREEKRREEHSVPSKQGCCSFPPMRSERVYHLCSWIELNYLHPLQNINKWTVKSNTPICKSEDWVWRPLTLKQMLRFKHSLDLPSSQSKSVKISMMFTVKNRNMQRCVHTVTQWLSADAQLR